LISLAWIELFWFHGGGLPVFLFLVRKLTHQVKSEAIMVVIHGMASQQQTEQRLVIGVAQWEEEGAMENGV
jgi:hypothetical protein